MLELGEFILRLIMKKLLLIVLSGLVLASCGGKNESVGVDIIKNPNSANGYNENEKMPVISFETDMHDFGQLMAGENISYSFKFTNTGGADLVISGCDASCGCTIADFPRERIAPGKSGYITVSFKSQGMSGPQLKEITVVSNAQPSHTKLRIMATVR